MLSTRAEAYAHMNNGQFETLYIDLIRVVPQYGAVQTVGTTDEQR